MPFSMRCNNTKFAPSFRVSSFGGGSSTLSFLTPSICVIQFCRYFDKRPLAKWVSMLGFINAFLSYHPNSKNDLHSL